MTKQKVVITDFEYENVDLEIELLEKHGLEVITAQCRTEEEVIDIAKDADGIINQYAPITEKVLNSLTNCKVVTRYGVGVDTINIEAATANNIMIGNVPDYGIDEVSDHALALIMDSLRRVTIANNLIKNGTWDVNVLKPIRRFNTLKVGLIGFGNIPRRLSEKLNAIGFTVLVSDPFVSEEVAKDKNVQLVNLDELCRLSDIISVHAPLNAHTKGMVGEEQFNLMKESAYVINTARGPIIDETALIKALEDNKIAGAALDVVEVEPIDRNNKLLMMDQVILTPHVAGYSEEAYFEMRAKAALGVIDVLAFNQLPKYHVNQSVDNEKKLADFNIDEHYNIEKLLRHME